MSPLGGRRRTIKMPSRKAAAVVVDHNRNVTMKFGNPKVRPRKQAQQRQKRAQRQRPTKVALPRVPRHPASVMVHVNPFSRYAEGARILDGFRAMTVAYPIPTSDILSTDATGAAQMLVLPSLACSALVLSGSISSTNGIFSFATTNQASGAATTLAGISAEVGTNLRDVGTSYRVVGWGVVVKTLPGVSSTGRVILTKFTPRGQAPGVQQDLRPYLSEAVVDFTGASLAQGSQTVDGTRPAIDALDNRPTLPNFLRQNGLPPLGSSDTATTMSAETLRRIPGTVTASVASLGVNGLLIRGKRTSNQFLAWRGVGPWPAVTGDIVTGASAMVATASAPVAFQSLTMNMFGKGVDSTYLDMSGHDGLALAVTGAAASTSVLDFEIIYHVEVTPRTEALLTSLRPPIADAEASPAVAAAVQQAHASTPHFQLVPHHFRELSNGVLAGLAGRFSQMAVAAASGTAGSVVGRAMTMGLEGAMGALTL